LIASRPSVCKYIIPITCLLSEPASKNEEKPKN
jgi:hypothetical protein